MWSSKFVVAWLMLVLFAMPAHANMSISTRDTIWSANCVAETVTLPFCRQGAGATLAAYRAVAGTYTAFSAGGGGGGDALVANPLSQFAATTSAQLAGVLSNETGTGLAVFATAPTFTTSITDPLLYGSSANTGTLTLASTSHGTPTTDAIIFQSGGVESGRIATFTSALDAATGERWLLQSPGWPGTYANQAYSMLRIDMLAQSGKANSALQVFLRDGTGDGIVTSFGSDSAAIQAWCTSEGAADSGNTTVCMNVGSVFSRKTLSGTIGNFTLEFDMQNYNQTCSSIIDPECGIIQKMVVHGNQPVTAFGIMRDFDVVAAKLGWIVTGVRDSFLYLTPSTTTGQTTVDIVRGITSGDTFYRHIQSYQGAMQWGPGTTATDVQASRTAVGALTVTSDLNSLTNTQTLRQTSNVSANDAVVASLRHIGKDSGAAVQEYGVIETYIRDNTAASEDSEMYFTIMAAGSLATQILVNSTGSTFNGTLTVGTSIVRIPTDGAGVFLDNGSYGFGIYRSGTTVHLLAGAIATPTVSLDANGFRGASLPASQTIASGNTVTADACGSVKRITAAGAVTTSTTDTFTAPAAGNSGCEMAVCNVGANAITLDGNANFVSADVVLAADVCVSVGSSGASGKWFQVGAASSVGGVAGGAANKVAYWTSATALSNDTNLHWDSTGNNLGIGTATFGTTLNNGIALLHDGANFPSTNIADVVQLYARDQGGSTNSSLFVKAEAGGIASIGDRIIVGNGGVLLTNGVIIGGLQLDGAGPLLQLSNLASIAHGITGAGVNTATFFDVRPVGTTDGGAQLRGVTELALGMVLSSITTTDPVSTKTTSSDAAMRFEFGKKFAANPEPMAAGVNLAVFTDVFSGLGSRWILDNDGDTWQAGTVTATQFFPVLTATQTIAAGNTVAADACGGIKRITAAGAVTTDTTNTFTAPAAGNSNCAMTVCNVGTNVITLDNNANFSAGGITGALSGTDVALGADDCVPVVSTGASGKWFQAGAGSTNG